MSYRFADGRQYLMPTHFGPMTGPRHSPDGREFPQPDRRLMERYDVSFPSERRALEALLPPQLELVGEPTVTISTQYMTNIGWLAGLGYNTLGVSVRARFVGERDTVEGSFLLVLWENLAEPILTGREQLGFSKIYCEIPQPRVVDGTVVMSAGWHGHKFFELVVSNLTSMSVSRSEVASTPVSILNLRYVPDVDKSTTARIIEVTHTVLPEQNPIDVDVRQTGTADFTFLPTSWNNMPTQYRIVEGLRQIPVSGTPSATYVHGVGARDAQNVTTMR